MSHRRHRGATSTEHLLGVLVVAALAAAIGQVGSWTQDVLFSQPGEETDAPTQSAPPSPTSHIDDRDDSDRSWPTGLPGDLPTAADESSPSPPLTGGLGGDEAPAEDGCDGWLCRLREAGTWVGAALAARPRLR